MRAVTFPEPFLTLNTDENLLFVHNTSSRKIFICSKSDHLIGFELSGTSEREDVPIDLRPKWRKMGQDHQHREHIDHPYGQEKCHISC